jgi:hypothetical protein
LRRLRLFKVVYAIAVLRDFKRWQAENKYRLAQARTEFTGGDTPFDNV